MLKAIFSIVKTEFPSILKPQVNPVGHIKVTDHENITLNQIGF